MRKREWIFEIDSSGRLVENPGGTANPIHHAAESGNGPILDWSGIKEFAMILESNSGPYSGTVNVRRRFSKDSDWLAVEALSDNGVRYLHTTDTGVFYDNTNQTFLPVASVQIENNAYVSGTATITIIAWDYGSS